MSSEWRCEKLVGRISRPTRTKINQPKGNEMTTETRNPNWWEDQDGFFGPEYLRQYDGTILTEDDTARQVDFVIKVTGAQSESTTILDVPCGHGRHALEFSRRGFRILGYELNKFFLKQAQQVAFEEKLWHPDTFAVNRINFRQGDMRELCFENKFDVALNLFTAMGYFSDDYQDEQFFTGVYRALKPEGMFVVDYLNRDRIVRNFRPNDQRELPDGSIVLTNREYDPLTGRMHDKRITMKDQKEVRRVESSIRFYGAHELINLAAKVGFKLWATYGDFDQSPLTMDSKRVILIFQR